MDPLKIEAADREFARKLQQLRSKLAGRQKTHGNGLLIRRRYRPTLLLTTLFIIFVMGLTHFVYRQQKGSPGVGGQPAAEGDPPAASRSAVDGGAGQSSPPHDQMAVEAHPWQNRLVMPALKTPLAPLPLDAAENSAKATASDPQPKPAAARVPQDEDKNDPRLVSVVVCQGVRNHQPLVENNQFDLADQQRAYVWMEVHAEGKPFVINHVYYHNGRKYCEVPLDIRPPRMRTWSYVTLWKAALAGTWSVEIVRDGKVLRKVGFQVRDDRLPVN
jgi:Protein of unknown function (DUF2914)